MERIEKIAETVTEAILRDSRQGHGAFKIMIDQLGRLSLDAEERTDCLDAIGARMTDVLVQKMILRTANGMLPEQAIKETLEYYGMLSEHQIDYYRSRLGNAYPVIVHLHVPDFTSQLLAANA